MEEVTEATLEPHILTHMKLLSAQVCSTGTEDEALEWLQRTNPAGTTNNWQKEDRPEAAPIHCEKYPERTHYLFTC